MKASDISRRHGDLTQKIKSLWIAVHDRKMQLKEMMTMGPRMRPKSGFLRTPNHIVSLKKMLAIDIEAVRKNFDQHSKGKFYNATEKRRCNGLICDLEKQLADIDLALINCLEEYQQKVENVDDNEDEEMIPEVEPLLVMSLLRVTTPLHVTPTPASEPPRNRSRQESKETLSSGGTPRLAEIASPNSMSSSVGGQAKEMAPIRRTPRQATLQTGLPRTLNNTLPDAKPKITEEKKRVSVAKVVECVPDYRMRLKHTRVVNVPPLIKADTARSSTYPSMPLHRQKTEFIRSNTSANLFRAQYTMKPRVGYPFGSSFPELPPLPKRKWDGNLKKYVAATSPGSPVLLPTEKAARQVVNIRQNTWLW